MTRVHGGFGWTGFLKLKVSRIFPCFYLKGFQYFLRFGACPPDKDLSSLFLAFDLDFGNRTYGDRHLLTFHVGRLEAVHFGGRQAKAFDNAVSLDDQALEVRDIAVARCPRVDDNEFEVGKHAVLVQRWIGTNKVDLPIISHLMDDLAEQQIYPVRCLESENQPDKEATLGNDSVDSVLAGVLCVNSVHVQKPVHVGSLRPLSEDRIDDVRVDVTHTVCHGKIDEIGRLLGDCRVLLEVLQHPYVMFEVDKLGMTFTKSPRAHEHVHDQVKEGRDNEGEPPAMRELVKVGYEKHSLDAEEYDAEH